MMSAAAVTAMLALSACGSGDGDASKTTTGDTTAAASSDSVVDTSDAADGETSGIEISTAVQIEGGALPQFDDQQNDAAVGTPAPIITGQHFDGTDVTIGGATETPTMLVFLAHWCPHCNDEIPEITKLRDAGELPADLNIVAISTAVDEDAPNYPPSEWIVDKDWTWPVMADDAELGAFQAYGGTGFPYTVMVDADGNVLARKTGNGPAAEIKEWIDTTLQGATA